MCIRLALTLSLFAVLLGCDSPSATISQTRSETGATDAAAKSAKSQKGSDPVEQESAAGAPESAAKPSAEVSKPDDDSQVAEAEDESTKAERPAAGNPGREAKTESVGSRRYALLVGCSKYYNLPQADLSGPSNDVALMQSLLREQFDFAADNIATLTEEQSPENRPTKKHIVREFKALSERVAKGDQVVILLSGHGTQQPDDDPDNKQDLEADGMDEVFCPADTEVSPFAAATTIPNGITDDELGRMLTDIRKQGAAVWIIIDSCHSGTAVRGNRVYRQIAPRTLLPKMADAPRQRSIANDAKTDGFEIDEEKLGGIVAIYASQPYEPTFELPLPVDADDAEPHGILTYTLAQVLMASDANMTYAELVKRIQDEYIINGVAAPTPLVEGSGRHNEVLGQKTWPDRSRLTLEVHLGTGMPKVAAGRLHGVNQGCIFALYPPAGEADQEEPLAYVKVTSAKKSYSIVEPCGFGDAEKTDQLTLGGRLEIVHYEYGDMQRAIAVDASEASDDFDAEVWNERLQELAASEASLIRLADNHEDADWLIRPIEGSKIVLVPSEGWPESPGNSKGFGPIPDDERAAVWLNDRLTRIARAQNLLKVGGVTQSQKEKGIFSFLLGKKEQGLQVEYIRLESEDDADGTVLKPDKSGLELEVDDLVAVRVTNQGREAVDVSLLFVDSGYGITPVFPSPETIVDNRLLPDKSITIGPMVIEGNSLGLEHLVVVGVKAEGTPIDFSWLAQDVIETTRSTGTSANPLDALLETALFARGNTRGIRMKSSSDATMKVISWRTVE